jgi:KUP system potassium uptake protein
MPKDYFAVNGIVKSMGLVFGDIGAILKEAGIDEKTIFYGMEDIVTSNVLWRVFSAIKHMMPLVVQFSKNPSDKVHGVVTRVEMEVRSP